MSKILNASWVEHFIEFLNGRSFLLDRQTLESLWKAKKTMKGLKMIALIRVVHPISKILNRVLIESIQMNHLKWWFSLKTGFWEFDNIVRIKICVTLSWITIQLKSIYISISNGFYLVDRQMKLLLLYRQTKHHWVLLTK